MNLVSKIRRFFCHHQWRPTKFQALVPSTSFECVKCGKLEYHDDLAAQHSALGYESNHHDLMVKLHRQFAAAIRQKGELDEG